MTTEFGFGVDGSNRFSFRTRTHTHTHTHTLVDFVDSTSMYEECVAVDAVGCLSSNRGLTAKSAP